MSAVGRRVCRISLVESIAENVTYAGGSVLLPSIYEAWIRLINSATKSIDIAAYYWTLTDPDACTQVGRPA